MAYHNQQFDRIAPEKQEKILSTAAAEFARYGYSSANINVIAQKCGISVGSLYNYFTTKENLFLTICSRTVDRLVAGFEEVTTSGGDLFDKIELILRMILSHSRENREMINLYNEITTEGNKELADKLSYQMESVSASYYTALLTEAQKQKSIDPDIDTEVFAFCLDNIFMTLQFSYASEYYRERMRTYIDDTIFNDDERVIQGILSFIRKALSKGKT